MTLSRAAAIAGRSYSWARDCAVDGRLIVERSAGPGPMLVSVASLQTLLAVSTAHARKPNRPYPRLVVDNTL